MNYLPLIMMVILAIILLRRIGPIWSGSGAQPESPLYRDACTLGQLWLDGFDVIPKLNSLKQRHGVEYCLKVAELARQLDDRVHLHLYQMTEDIGDKEEYIRAVLTKHGASEELIEQVLASRRASHAQVDAMLTAREEHRS